MKTPDAETTPLFDEARELGRGVALKRGTTQGHPDDIHYIKEHMAATAASKAPPPYDPGHNPHDAALEEELERLENDQEALQLEYDTAVRKLEEAERERANLSVLPEKPQNPGCAVLIATLFMALTLILAFHDGFYVSIEDDRLAWIMSGLTALLVGGGICYLILGEFKNTSHSSKASWGLIGGLGLCLGLAAVRFWACGFTTEGAILALALFLLEAGILIALEIVAAGLRRRHLAYTAHLEQIGRFDELVGAASKKVSRLDERIQTVEGKIRDLRTERSERISRSAGIASLTNLCIAAALEGYQAGLAELEGLYHGNWEFKKQSHNKGNKENAS
jgi:archaellum component FlaC